MNPTASGQPYAHNPSQTSTGYLGPVAPPGSADIAMAETIEAEDDEMDDGDSEPVAAISADT